MSIKIIRLYSWLVNGLPGKSPGGLPAAAFLHAGPPYVKGCQKIAKKLAESPVLG